MNASETGPLEPHLESFAGLLAGQGYGKAIISKKLRLLADLNRWLKRKGIRLRELDEQQIADFLQWRWRRVARGSGDQATLALLLRDLRGKQLVPAPSLVTGSEVDLIGQDYRKFLLHERALSLASVEQYLAVTRRFLSHQFPSGKAQLKNLSAGKIADFVLHDTSQRGRRSAQLMSSVLRSFLNFLFQHGRIETNLSGAVPTVAGWRLSELPRF